MENTKMENTSSTKNLVKAAMHNNPSKNHRQVASYWGKVYLKRKVFACFQKDSKDGAHLASCGREFQSLGASTEETLSWVPIRQTCESGVYPQAFTNAFTKPFQ